MLAVILARGGSKRVPRKNLRAFRGKRLIEWAWEAAWRSQYITKLVLSTDDEEIMTIAAAAGVTVIRRPPELSTDTASSEDALRHTLDRYPAEWVVLLQPTSPLRLVADIDGCIERARMGDGCVSINRATGRPNGAVYVAKSDWLMLHDFRHLGLMKYVMPEERSLDIDTEADFA